MNNHKLNNKRDTFYYLEISDSINASIEEAEAMKRQIEEMKPLQTDVWKTIQEKLRIDWTYDSNAIEGSTLTRGETMFFLQEGLTTEGKPFKDFLDAKNHAEAIDYLFEVIKNERPISEGVVKEINSLLLHGVSHTVAMTPSGQKVKKPAHPGAYKKNPNHVQQFDGSIHYYTEPLHVKDEMEFLVSWVNKNSSLVHPIIISATLHYNLVRIHPFDDGNGRGARLLMNLVLMKEGYPPAVIRNKNRRKYIECLSKADSGDSIPFIEFVLFSLKSTMNTILSDLKS
jgi:Fic family protein